MTIISLHVAMAENRVIGREGGLPWRLSTDLKRFKAQTTGKPVVMGRKTFDSMGKPLPGRLNIVVTRDRDWRGDGVEVVHSLDDALALAKARLRCMAEDEVCVIGGGQIFEEAMPLADRLHVTHVLAQIEGDTVFPSIDPAAWEETTSEEVPAGEKDDFASRFTIYRRR
ncbi:MAG: dihydrofolate reductase [Methylobacterium mesophilicum]|nr:dihydrofolate reductase [Methylobacterium mesophilicum]